jgi:threonyl-tRNA synthetase
VNAVLLVAARADTHTHNLFPLFNLFSLPPTLPPPPPTMAATAVESAADGVAALAVQDHKAAALARAPFYARRIELFEQFHARQQASVEAARAAAVPIKIVLPDGAVKEGIKGATTPLEVAAGISKSLAKKVVVAKVDGAVWDAFRPLEGDCALQLLSFDDPDGRETFWHSSAHVLGEALELEFGVDLTIGPALEEGFYYDCYMGDRVRLGFFTSYPR